MRNRLSSLNCSVVLLLASVSLSCRAAAQEFYGTWKKTPNRTWIGPDFWANRLQDWRISNGRLECITPQKTLPLRTVCLLTRSLSSQRTEFQMSIDCGLTPSRSKRVNSDAAAGFLIGVGNGEIDFRSAALVSGRPGKGGGLFCGTNSKGQPLIIDLERSLPVEGEEKHISRNASGYHVELTGRPGEKDDYLLRLRVLNAKRTKILGVLEKHVPASRVIGSIALASHPGCHPARGKAGLFWFEKLKVVGAKIRVHEDRALGPILSTQFAQSRDVMKLTAQCMPLSVVQPQQVKLQIINADNWETVDETTIIVPGWTATFRVTDWDGSREVRYRVLYSDQNGREYDWIGVIPEDPVEKGDFTVAGFSCNLNNSRTAGVGWPSGKVPKPCDWLSEIYFPHSDIVRNVVKHRPDLLFFAGDQIYEGDSPSFPDKKNIVLDYMYKWYLWCWAFRDLTNSIPTVCLPDDHDVYQGNLWGEGGKEALERSSDGGYEQPAWWVNMVHRTQASHLPDPYDPTPIDQGISVYYTDILYGRISFALLADRMFKSGCRGKGLPPTGSNSPDRIRDPNLDTRDLDLPGLKLLGDRQLEFLEHWISDWHGADMKLVLSQTVLANAATHHGPGLLRCLADLDSNGWPQSGRNRALSVMRKGFAFHICGDQHLAVLLHNGVSSYGDAIWTFAVPAIANFYPRAWAPNQTGKYDPQENNNYTGEFLDGFGNKITLLAAANPGRSTGREPAHLHEGVPGYGIVKLDKINRTITSECWPRYADPDDPSTGGQYKGWPRTVNQIDNYAREPKAWLPKIFVKGTPSPVISVINEASREVIYALRIKGNVFQPPVYEDGTYLLEIGEPGTERVVELNQIESTRDRGSAGTLTVEIPAPKKLE